MQELEAKEVKFPQVAMNYESDTGQTRFYFLRAIFDLVDMNQDGYSLAHLLVLTNSLTHSSGEIDDKEVRTHKPTCSLTYSLTHSPTACFGPEIVRLW